MVDNDGPVEDAAGGPGQAQVDLQEEELLAPQAFQVGLLRLEKSVLSGG